MTGAAQVALLGDGRLHLHHGPIDIIAESYGAEDELSLAYRQAAARFATVLDELVPELGVLRRPIGDQRPDIRGAIARRMVEAVWPHRADYITPMAAVAGAVADEVLAAMVGGRTLARAYVNNGGDIALHLVAGERLRAGLVADQDRPALDAAIEVDHASPVRGLATSGWRGRSHSLGIADAVTVLARSTAVADAAATLIANAVDVDHPAIRRTPARHLRDDTDLGDLPVTVEVGVLAATAVEEALESGRMVAERMRATGLIVAAGLLLQGQATLVGTVQGHRLRRGGG